MWCIYSLNYMKIYNYQDFNDLNHDKRCEQRPSARLKIFFGSSS